MPFKATPVYVTKAALFRTLGHPARVRILELLRDGELSVGTLQEELGIDSGGTSQHLAALRRIGLVDSRREGTSVYYRAADPQVFALLEVGRALIARALAEQQALLEELSAE
ncbi:putative transcriptional regulator [Gaiella occulta]|uniref:Putative transcriptional regulator n=1 Tax=Gaiella occulta TaxID=1002870 RepID=A0A7M2Z0M0_9ACTN|nr:metalloregulator ArsR/SmtB family transcription factor [Gaiella occulta]RDI75323.1 putative transcriptional regulator [Gaiella occulta]